MPYIFGKLWHLAIIWAIRKAFQGILQGVRILLANHTRISPTSDNDSHILFVLWGNFPLNCSPRLCKSVHISAPASESDTRCKFYSSSPFVKDRNTSWSNFSINFIKYISRWYGSTFILGSCHCLYCFLEWRSVLDFRDFLEFWISVVNFMVKICGFMPSGNVVNLPFSALTAHQDGYM